ncbi:hypothetical protein PR202_ga00241 [Eleusine coracana subsp. coracana]|uniref:Uncharacterized protein n=1 Tax=Eleusine coracana subsp. coracana TaxID=191504 RepID=A0AAV5BFR5_ELECO|nr:hypothetical protein PR202_ga00241 [Eleusine coracana subsp. coracana]
MVVEDLGRVAPERDVRCSEGARCQRGIGTPLRGRAAGGLRSVQQTDLRHRRELPPERDVRCSEVALLDMDLQPLRWRETAPRENPPSPRPAAPAPAEDRILANVDVRLRVLRQEAVALGLHPRRRQRAREQRGSHDLRIDGPSFAAGALVPTGHFLTSRAFTVGGRRWRVMHYPNGSRADKAGYVSVFLTLDEEAVAGEEVTAVFDFTLLAESRGAFFLKTTKKVKRNSPVRCQVVVINGVRTEEKGAPKSKVDSVPVPPPDLHKHLGNLLETKKGTDVVFNVGGETFAAHRFVLAARSPVLGAELFSVMKESGADGVIRIDNMEPGVFQALLCFAYTDSLPEMKKEETNAMYQHLLVAANRAATILTLADQHHCDGLKKACLDFLKAPANLRAVVASDGFDHLSTSCPSIKKDLLDSLAA